MTELPRRRYEGKVQEEIHGSDCDLDHAVFANALARHAQLTQPFTGEPA